MYMCCVCKAESEFCKAAPFFAVAAIAVCAAGTPSCRKSHALLRWPGTQKSSYWTGNGVILADEYVVYNVASTKPMTVLRCCCAQGPTRYMLATVLSNSTDTEAIARLSTAAMATASCEGAAGAGGEGGSGSGIDGNGDGHGIYFADRRTDRQTETDR